MPALRLDIEYDGAGFAGWAVQPGYRTVEGVLLEALDFLVHERPPLRVAGRTDAGVHATAQVVSMKLAGSPMSREPARLLRALAGVLPADVAVRAVSITPDGFDARADARSRTYEYRVLIGPPSPLRRHRTLRHVGQPLDRMALNACARMVCGQHDFRAFTPTTTKHMFFDRTVLACQWRDDGDELVLCIEANAFLRRMVRVLVGTMLECGRGYRSLDSFAGLLEGATRSDAGVTAPPGALTLVAVRYR